MPPSRTDVGSTITVSDEGLRNALKVSSGAHWASGTRSRNVPYDFGAGMIYQRTDAVVPADKTGQKPSDSSLHEVGGYVEFSTRLDAHNLTRSWVGARAEIMATPERRITSAALLGRVSWELYGGGVAAGGESDSQGGVAGIAGGTTAIGAFMESGYRRHASGENEFVVAGGLSFRLPAIAFIAFAAP